MNKIAKKALRKIAAHRKVASWLNPMEDIQRQARNAQIIFALGGLGLLGGGLGLTKYLNRRALRKAQEQIEANNKLLKPYPKNTMSPEAEEARMFNKQIMDRNTLLETEIAHINQIPGIFR